MIVLGIETATPYGGAALWEDGQILADIQNDGTVSHSQRLMPAIDRALRGAERAIGDLDAVAVSIGPGSFTGLRIGLAVAKSLAYDCGKPIIAVPTLEALAAHFSRPGIVLAPMLDARRSEIFGAMFLLDQDIHRLSPDIVESPEAFARRLKKPCLAAGPGAQRYAELLKAIPADAIELAEGALNRPSAASVAALGAQRLIDGHTASALTLEPVYVRKSDAELSRARRQSKQP